MLKFTVLKRYYLDQKEKDCLTHFKQNQLGTMQLNVTKNDR